MNSCIGCKFLYKEDSGYSNYTVEETTVNCAIRRNPNLPSSEPYDWYSRGMDADNDNWPRTNDSRCDRFSPGKYIWLDVDHEEKISELSDDPEQVAAIQEHSGRD